MIFEWHDSNIEKPDKNCTVLVCYVSSRGTEYEMKSYEVIGYTTNLYSLDRYDFRALKNKEDKSGFYRLDSEFGFVDVHPDAWTYISEYNPDLIKEARTYVNKKEKK